MSYDKDLLIVEDNKYKEFLKNLDNKDLYRGYVIGSFVKAISSAVFNRITEDHKTALSYLREYIKDSFIDLGGEERSFEAYEAKCRDLYYNNPNGIPEINMDLKFFEYLKLSLPEHSIHLASLSHLVSSVMVVPTGMNEVFTLIKKLFYYETFLTYFNVSEIKDEPFSDTGTFVESEQTEEETEEVEEVGEIVSSGFSFTK